MHICSIGEAREGHGGKQRANTNKLSGYYLCSSGARSCERKRNPHRHFSVRWKLLLCGGFGSVNSHVKSILGSAVFDEHSVDLFDSEISLFCFCFTCLLLYEIHKDMVTFMVVQTI